MWYPSPGLPIALSLTCVDYLEKERRSSALFLLEHDEILRGGKLPRWKPLASIRDTPPKHYKYDPNNCYQVVAGLSAPFKTVPLQLVEALDHHILRYRPS